MWFVGGSGQRVGLQRILGSAIDSASRGIRFACGPTAALDASGTKYSP
jgi:ABC-type hemin transport system ATPase subunit